MRVEMSQIQSLEALHDGGAKCNRTKVIKACYSGMFWHRHDGGGFEARGDSCLEQ